LSSHLEGIILLSKEFLPNKKALKIANKKIKDN
jgi:hypothetical protein